MQFYLLVPLIFSILKFRNSYFYKILITTCFLLASLILYLHLTHTWAFEFLFCRVWQFMAGILAFYFGGMFARVDSSKDPSNNLLNEPLLFDSTESLNKSSILHFLFSYLLLALLLILFVVNLLSRFENVFVIFMTAMLLYLGSIHESDRVLSNYVMVWIGDLSYTLYLIHWPVIQLFRYLFSGLEFGLFGNPIPSYYYL